MEKNTIRNLIARAESLVKLKNYRKVTKYVDDHKIDMYSYIISDYNDFKKNDSFFLRGFAVIDDCIVSPSIEKFFNVNENIDWTLDDDTDLIDSIITEKFDGTLIIPFIVDNKLFFRTKMDVNNQFTDLANKCLTDTQRDEIFDFLSKGIYPFYELISPFNQIVVKYAKTELKLICLYSPEIGYFSPQENNICGKFKNLSNIKSYLQDIQNFEGYVFYHKNRIYKIKAHDYIFLHKATSECMNYKSALYLILDEKDDDVIPHITNDEVLKFITNIKQKVISRISYLMNIIENADITLARKDFCTRYRSSVNTFEFAILMKYYDRKISDLDSFIKQHLKKCLTKEQQIHEYLDI